MTIAAVLQRTGALVHVADPCSGPTDVKMVRALHPLRSGRVAAWSEAAVIFILGLATTERIGSGPYAAARKWREAPA
ncbi:hypothetical protein [Stakelama saccharophila]|uniref:Uncharacterized protein n=1 Tax=Stakelama saccharophila TaxID=3075605 RepID=A0ABZ0BA08_9SPHN|nr:hypothetical protein [Stakelama sp. W311]WNO54108.1 hypothetical protein RPR59_02275 [Stakelama sp. W311]